MPAPKGPPQAYQFVMDKWTPKTLPMKRLVQYLDKLAQLAGNADHVHFAKITEGSARPQWNVDDTAALDVLERVSTAADGSWAEGAKLRKDINKLLYDDGCVGYLRVVDGPRLIEFPGRRMTLAAEMTVHEFGELEGQVIRVGGKDATVPVHIQGSDGQYYKCQANKEKAKLLAKHLYTGQVRVSGRGTWRRTTEGVWQLEAFVIADYITLQEEDLTTLVAAMREIPGSGWNEMEDPQQELKRMRED